MIEKIDREPETTREERGSRQIAAARRKATELASHCQFYGIPLETVLDLDVPTIPPPIDLAAFDAPAFNAWRERLGLSYVRAAEALGISARMAKYYGGAGKPAPGRSGVIPRTVALACEALELRKALGR